MSAPRLIWISERTFCRVEPGAGMPLKDHGHETRYYSVSLGLWTLMKDYGATVTGEDNDLAGLIADRMEDERGDYPDRDEWWDALQVFMRDAFISRSGQRERPDFNSYHRPKNPGK